MGPVLLTSSRTGLEPETGCEPIRPKGPECLRKKALRDPVSAVAPRSAVLRLGAVARSGSAGLLLSSAGDLPFSERRAGPRLHPPPGSLRLRSLPGCRVQRLLSPRRDLRPVAGLR